MSGTPEICPVCGSPGTPKWSDRPPSKPGWYAVKHLYRDRYLKEDIAYVDVVRVAESSQGELGISREGGSSVLTGTGKGRLLWYGPLVLPE